MITRPKRDDAQPGKAPRENAAHRQDEGESRWAQHLPNEWRDAIDPPLYFEHYCEYEIAASRSVGYDADDLPCFTAHQFQLTQSATDDDEEFYEVVSHSEELAAWRLRDERWLVFRKDSTDSGQPPRSFYSVSRQMPR